MMIRIICPCLVGAAFRWKNLHDGVAITLSIFLILANAHLFGLSQVNTLNPFSVFQIESSSKARRYC